MRGPNALTTIRSANAQRKPICPATTQKAVTSAAIASSTPTKNTLQVNEVGEERRLGMLEPDPEVEPPSEPAGLSLGCAGDRGHVVGAEARKPFQHGVDHPDHPEADPQRVLRPRNKARGLCADLRFRHRRSPFDMHKH